MGKQDTSPAGDGRAARAGGSAHISATAETEERSWWMGYHYAITGPMPGTSWSNGEYVDDIRHCIYCGITRYSRTYLGKYVCWPYRYL